VKGCKMDDWSVSRSGAGMVMRDDNRFWLLGLELELKCNGGRMDSVNSLNLSSLGISPIMKSNPNIPIKIMLDVTFYIIESYHKTIQFIILPFKVVFTISFHNLILSTPLTPV